MDFHANLIFPWIIAFTLVEIDTNACNVYIVSGVYYQPLTTGKYYSSNLTCNYNDTVYVQKTNDHNAMQHFLYFLNSKWKIGGQACNNSCLVEGQGYEIHEISVWQELKANDNWVTNHGIRVKCDETFYKFRILWFVLALVLILIFVLVISFSCYVCVPDKETNKRRLSASSLMLLLPYSSSTNSTIVPHQESTAYLQPPAYAEPQAFLAKPTTIPCSNNVIQQTSPINISSCNQTPYSTYGVIGHSDKPP